MPKVSHLVSGESGFKSGSVFSKAYSVVYKIKRLEESAVLTLFKEGIPHSAVVLQSPLLKKILGLGGTMKSLALLNESVFYQSQKHLNILEKQ